MAFRASPIFAFILLFGILAPAYTQPSTTTPPKAKKLYDKAGEALRNAAPEKAAHYLEAALDAFPAYFEARIQLAGIRSDQGKYEEAEALYREALEARPTYRPIVWYQAAVVSMRLQRFEDAVQQLDYYLTLPSRNHQQTQLAESLRQKARFSATALQHPVPFQPESLGPAINTSLPEYLPSLSADGQLLVFTRVVDGQEDFFYSVRDSAGVWAEATPLHELNTLQNEGAHCLSADGRTLLFTACNYPGGMGSCDLFISTWENGAWTKARNLGPPVNTASYESQPSLSADGNTLVFTSTRPGGLGKNDLWFTFRQPDGRWATPQNAGPLLNTSEDDQAPFLHPDGQTLYFMSKGHPGMGNFDLFFSRKDSTGTWSTPTNLGYPINTSAHEGALIVQANGKKAFFTKEVESASNGRPVTDIYTFDLYPAARPQAVTLVKGHVRDAQSGEPLAASIQIQDVFRSEALTQSTSTSDGTFLVCLPIGKDYALHVQKAGYIFYSDFFRLSEPTDSTSDFQLDVRLQAIQPVVASTDRLDPTPVVLRNVFFSTGSAALLETSQDELLRLHTLLETHPDMRIQLNGHTDDVGDAQANQRLSEQRAKAVYDFLVAKGIAPNRLSYQGFGATRPVVANDSDAHRSLNRRTEFIRIY